MAGGSRGYYRCSSSKGCPARKQVERSRTDPSMFIITFTSDHNHPAPTHRNSLAGSTRQKHTPPPAAAATPPELSPATPTTNTSAEEEGSSGQPAKQEEEVDQVDAGAADENMFMELAELHTPPEAGIADNWFADVVFPAPWLAAGTS